MSMRTAIILVLLVAVLPSLLVQAGVYYHWFQTSQRHDLDVNKELSRSLASTFDVYVQDLKQHMHSLGAALSSQKVPSTEEITAMLKSSAQGYPSLDLFFMMNPQGKVVASSDPKILGFDVSDRSYYQDALRTRDAVMSDLLEGRADPNPIFVVAKAIWAGNELRGVVAGSVNSERLGEAILKVVRHSGGVCIFDRQGRVVYRYPSRPLKWHERMNSETDGLLERALAGQEAAGTFRFAGDQRDQIGSRVPIAGIGWVAGASEPKGASTAALLTSLSWIIGINLAVVLASLCCAWLISHDMIHGLRRLRAHALAVGQGDAVAPAGGGRISEVSDLASAFNEMVVLRKQAEDARRRAEDQFLLATEAAGIGDWSWEPSTNAVSCSQRAKAILGLPPDAQPTYEGFLNALHPDDRQKVEQTVRQSIERGAAYDVEYRIIWPDQSIHWIYAKGKTVKDGDKSVRLVGVAVDVTHHRRAQEQLKTLARLTEENPNPLLRIKDDFTLTLWNEAAAPLLKTWLCRPNQPVPAEIQEIVKRALATEENYESEVAGPDGQVFLATFAPVVEAGYVNVYAQNITGLKRADRKLKHTAAELVRSNRDLGHFASMAAHDMKEPLRAVGGFVNLLGERYGDKLDAKAGEYIKLALDGVERMQAMIHDLLAYARAGSQDTRFEPVDTRIAVERAMANLQAGIEEAAAEIAVDPLPTVPGDAGQLTQLFQNLIGNAVKFRQEGRRPQVHIGAQLTEGQWQFCVKDNGIGIDPKLKDEAFTVFKRLHSREKYEGSGMGLAICKRIVEHHGGTIWVESRPDEGSAFFFTIPQEAGGSGATQEAETNPQPAAA